MTPPTQNTTIGKTENPHIGIDAKARSEIVAELAKLLADDYTLYVKTHAYHFNVTGPNFGPLHALFEEQYNDLWAAFDEIAERIRTLGDKVSLAGKTLAKNASVPGEEPGDENLSADEMIRHLVAGHETIAKTIRAAMKVAEGHGDDGTLDLLTTRLAVHEKTAWMLRAHLG